MFVEDEFVKRVLKSQEVSAEMICNKDNQTATSGSVLLVRKGEWKHLHLQ